MPDPQIIFDSMNWKRMEWDQQMTEVIELTEWTTKHTSVHVLNNKSVIGTTPRQFIDKKIFFRTSDVDPAVKGTDKDEIYIWVTSGPDELYPLDSKFVRAHANLGIQKIGRNKNGKAGCFMHSIVQTDVKVSAWTTKILYPMVPKQVNEWAVNFRAFCNKQV